MKILTSTQFRAFDKSATEDFKIPPAVLMENAALRVVELVEQKFAPLGQQRVALFCGKGNNGGDGLAVARHLLGLGCRLTVVLAAPGAALKGEAATNYAALLAAIAGLPPEAAEIVEAAGDKLTLSATQRRNLQNTDIAIDALLGTGFHGELRPGPIAEALRLMAGLKKPVIAIDLPSGLDADTGHAAKETVAADFTVTFAAPKSGFFLRDGARVCGELWLGGIGTPPALMEQAPDKFQLLSADIIRDILPHREIDAHKGDAGRVIVIGGSVGMSGAPALAARAALAAGAGLCIGCTPEKVQPFFAASILEATSHPLACDDDGRLVPSAADSLPTIWKGAHVVALGPGISRSDGALAFVRRVAVECPLPLVIDADALYALPAIADQVKLRKAPTMLTPHPGEMAELMGIKTADVQNDRFGTALRCAEKYGAIVVLKGARSLIATPTGKLYVNPTGNPGMATGGSGDVLTGTLAGLMAQIRDAEKATILAVYLHGLAGDLAFATKGNGLVAGDIASHLSAAILAAGATAPESASRLRRLL